MAADERGEDLKQPAGELKIVRDAFQGVHPAQVGIEAVRAGLAELVYCLGEPLGDLAFLDDGDLLAYECELFVGAVVTLLCLLAGVFKPLAAHADLP